MSSFTPHNVSQPKGGQAPLIGASLPFAHLSCDRLMLDGVSINNPIDGISVTYSEKEAKLFIDASLKRPLIVYRTFPLSLSIIVGPSECKASIIEVFCPDETLKRASFVTNVDVKDHSSCYFYRFFHHESAICHQSTFNLSEQAELKLYDAGLHQGEVMLTTDVHLQRQKASLNYVGLDFLKSRVKRHHDLTIFHEAKETISNQVFRGVYTDFSEGTFLGKVNIMKHANQSVAHQLYRAILLSDHAKALVRPQLEIYHNDIKASHGATIGSLDENQLFYLRSRGLSKHEAEAMLIEALVTELLVSMEVTELADYLRQTIVSNLKDGGAKT